MHNAAFHHAEHIVHDIWTYYFTLPPGYSYIAGQYAELAVAHDKPDSRGTHRVLTFSSSPTEELLAVTFKIPEDCSSYKIALQRLKPGDTVRITEPMGDLVLPIQQETPLVFVAGGLGIASFRGMLKYLADKSLHQPITLHYVVRDPKEKIFLDVIDASPAELHSYEPSTERLSSQHMLQSTTPDTIFYISGSQTFTLGARDILAQSGVPTTQIVFDYYDGYAEL